VEASQERLQVALSELARARVHVRFKRVSGRFRRAEYELLVNGARRGGYARHEGLLDGQPVPGATLPTWKLACCERLLFEARYR